MAALLVGIGLTIFGVAVGFVYLDQREMAVAHMQIEASAMASGKEPPPFDPVLLMQTPKRIKWAIGCGPLGAGMVLSGLLLAAFELPWLRRGPSGSV